MVETLKPFEIGKNCINIKGHSSQNRNSNSQIRWIWDSKWLGVLIGSKSKIPLNWYGIKPNREIGSKL